MLMKRRNCDEKSDKKWLATQAKLIEEMAVLQLIVLLNGWKERQVISVAGVI